MGQRGAWGRCQGLVSSLLSVTSADMRCREGLLCTEVSLCGSQGQSLMVKTLQIKSLILSCSCKCWYHFMRVVWFAWARCVLSLLWYRAEYRMTFAITSIFLSFSSISKVDVAAIWTLIMLLPPECDYSSENFITHSQLNTSVAQTAGRTGDGHQQLRALRTLPARVSAGISDSTTCRT